MSLTTLKGTQAMSQAARNAIRAFKLREFPRRHELTEKAFLARVSGRPHDEDMVIPIHVGWGREESNRWALMAKDLVLPERGSVIFRNQVNHPVFPQGETGEEIEGDRFAFNGRGLVNEEGKFHHELEKLNEAEFPAASLVPMVVFANPEQDSMEDMTTSCNDELGRCKAVFLFENRSLGAASFACVPFDIVTNCKPTARLLGQMLSVMPASRAKHAKKSREALTLMHCNYRDVDLPDIDTYAAFNAKLVVARGQFEPWEMMQLMAKMVARKVGKERHALMFFGTALMNQQGEVSLHLGSTEFSSPELVAAHNVVWGLNGVSRVWDGYVVQRVFHPLPKYQTRLPHPSRIVFPPTVKTVEDLKAQLEQGLIVANEVGQSFSFFEKLVKDNNVKLVFAGAEK